MCFTPIKRTPLRAALTDSTSKPTNKNPKGSTYTISDIQDYREQTKTTLKNYTTLGAQEKSVASAPEFIGIKGAVAIPAATSYTDSQTSITEIASTRGELAAATQSQNIELCGFLNDLPTLDFDMSAPQGGIPTLQDLMKAVNGVSMPVMEFAADGIVSVIGGATKAVTDLASAVQTSIPTVSCGKTPIDPIAPVSGLGSALVPPTPSTLPAAPAAAAVGVTPTISVSSPDVTVQSLNDVIDAGEI